MKLTDFDKIIENAEKHFREVLHEEVLLGEFPDLSANLKDSAIDFATTAFRKGMATAFAIVIDGMKDKKDGHEQNPGW